MPAKSESQARTARVAKAVKEGKLSLRSIKPKGFRRAVRSMMSMDVKQLGHFTHR